MNPERAAARGAVFSSRADVVLDVATAQHAARIDVLEAGKNVGRRLVDDVRHDVDPAAMAHGQDPFGGAQPRSPFQDLVEHGDEGSIPLERKPFGAEIAGLQYLLEQDGPDKPLQDGSAVGPGWRALDALGPQA